jgi:hypothetical protein
VNGEVELRRSPPVALFKWPLTVGQQWEQTYTLERPKERQTEQIQATCKTEAEETITVPAGAFRSFRSVCRNKLTGNTMFELWYSPHVGSFIRDKSTQRTGGVRERELIEFRLR